MDHQNFSAPSRAQITPAQQLNADFTRIYTQFQPRITRLVQHEVRGGNRHLAEDLTADAFYRAWLDLHKCTATSDGQVYAWLATLARRTVLAHYRTKKNTAETPVDTGTWSFANREMESGAGYYTPAATGFRTATITGDVCPLCEYFRCRCNGVQPQHPAGGAR